MAWTKIFQSRHTEWLEAEMINQDGRHQVELKRVQTIYDEQLMRLEEKRKDEIAHLEALYLDAKMEAMRERSDLKKTHAEELSRVIEDNRRLCDDLDRTRLYLTPALQSVSLGKETDSSSPPKPEEVVTGTPWQRILRREMLKQEQEAAANLTKPADAPVGGSDGSNGEGRHEAPQREQSKPA